MTRLNFIAFAPAVILYVAGAVLLNTMQAHAQVTTDRMTCKQAIATYEKNRRIYVRTRSGTVLSIYSGVPISQKRHLRCGRSSGASGYRVKTKDTKKCVVFYKCS